METTGMTEGGQNEEYASLEMMRGSLEEPEIKEETESMDDERDPEVGKLCTSYVCFSVVDWELEIDDNLWGSLIVWSNDGGDKISEVKRRFACKRGSSQSSSFKGHSGYRSPSAGSSSPGCQQEEEKATEKSRFVSIFTFRYLWSVNYLLWCIYYLSIFYLLLYFVCLFIIH